MDKRTKNRLKEHADHKWVAVRSVPSLAILNAVPSTLMRCGCGWFGWMPTDAVDIADAVR